MDSKRYSRYYTFIKPVIKNKQVQTYSPLVFSLISIMVFGLFAIKPTVSTILALQKSIKQEQDILDQLTKKEYAISQGTNNFNKIPPTTLAKIDTLLPNRTAITDLTNDLVTIANANQASMSALQFQPINLVGQPQTLSAHPSQEEILFTINIQGDYPKITKLINDLNNSDRMIVIDSVNLTQGSDNPLVATINARSFYLQN